MIDEFMYEIELILKLMIMNLMIMNLLMICTIQLEA